MSNIGIYTLHIIVLLHPYYLRILLAQNPTLNFVLVRMVALKLIH